MSNSLSAVRTHFHRQPSHRIIQNLMSASLCKNPPSLIASKKKLKGSAARGLAFQRKVGKRLKQLIALEELFGILKDGEWYEFIDQEGIGFCQPDFELHYPDHIVCIECKLTQTPNAHLQVAELYKPVLQRVYQKKVFAIQATPMLIYKPNVLVGDLADFVYEPTDGEVVWHVTR